MLFTHYLLNNAHNSAIMAVHHENLTRKHNIL
jgi:hypothetical protein